MPYLLPGVEWEVFQNPKNSNELFQVIEERGADNYWRFLHKVHFCVPALVPRPLRLEWLESCHHLLDHSSSGMKRISSSKGKCLVSEKPRHSIRLDEFLKKFRTTNSCPRLRRLLPSLIKCWVRDLVLLFQFSLFPPTLRPDNVWVQDCQGGPKGLEGLEGREGREGQEGQEGKGKGRKTKEREGANKEGETEFAGVRFWFCDWSGGLLEVTEVQRFRWLLDDVCQFLAWCNFPCCCSPRDRLFWASLQKRGVIQNVGELINHPWFDLDWLGKAVADCSYVDLAKMENKRIRNTLQQEVWEHTLDKGRRRENRQRKRKLTMRIDTATPTTSAKQRWISWGLDVWDRTRRRLIGVVLGK